MNIVEHSLKFAERSDVTAEHSREFAERSEQIKASRSPNLRRSSDHTVSARLSHCLCSFRWERQCKATTNKQHVKTAADAMTMIQHTRPLCNISRNSQFITILTTDNKMTVMVTCKTSY